MGDVVYSGQERVIDVRRVDKVFVKPGNIYNSLNQDNILSIFPHVYPADPESLTVLYVTFKTNPIILSCDIDKFVKLSNAEIANVIKRQKCIQQDGPFDPHLLFPKSGHEVGALALVHLFSHILLFYAPRCLDPIDLDVEDFTCAELVFSNKYNPVNEAIVVFNFPSRTAHVAILADIILNYLNRWLKGQETSDFESFMNEQSERNDLLRLKT